MGKKLGQHFLNNPMTALKVVNLLSPKKGENILEIGPGTGFLTSYLLDRPVRVFAVEIDSGLARCLRDKFKKDNIKVINNDFLKADMRQLDPDKICGNLPYQICGKIIEKILITSCDWKRAVLMLPLAVALRTAAAPGESEYSRLSVLCRRAGNIKVEFKVEKNDFSPPPRIESAVINIERKHSPGKEFICIVKAAFSERRKKVKNSLSNYFHLSPEKTMGILSRCNINPDLRAQQMTVDHFRALKKEFVKRKIL